jgi:hypothetical protein
MEFTSMNKSGTNQPYQTPTVVDYGDLQELTAACLGGSGGDAGFPGSVGGYGVGPSNPAAGCKSAP